jgi:hypothetical protein
MKAYTMKIAVMSEYPIVANDIATAEDVARETVIRLGGQERVKVLSIIENKPPELPAPAGEVAA